MYVQPSTSFEATAQFDTGLAGTLGVRITDNAGNTTLARQTAGIAEYPAGSGLYAVTLTSPGTAGQYSLVWDDGTNWAEDELVVTTATVLSTIGSGNLYVTADDLKTILGIDADTYADIAVDAAVSAASRAIDGYKGARYYATTETRYYTAASRLQPRLYLGDLVSVSSVTVDTDDDGSYDTTWTEGTDFYLDPPNAALESLPKRELVLYERAGRNFPDSQLAVKVTGSFGWAATPALVQQAAILLANRLLTRTRTAPLAIQVATAGEAVSMARLGHIDPDVAFLLDQLPSSRPAVTSVQLS